MTRWRVKRLLCSAAVLGALAVCIGGCHQPNPPHPNPPCCEPNPAPTSQQPDPGPTSQQAATTAVALFPDGTPAANFQLIFFYGIVGGDYEDLTTDSQGNFQLPDYSSCLYECELFLYVPADANQDLFNQTTNYHEINCELPLAASPNAQTWRDIQLGQQSPTTLYVVNSDCQTDWSLAGAQGSWHASLSLSQAGDWVNTTGLEQMMSQGQLDESESYQGQ